VYARQIAPVDVEQPLETVEEGPRVAFRVRVPQPLGDGTGPARESAQAIAADRHPHATAREGTGGAQGLPVVGRARGGQHDPHAAEHTNSALRARVAGYDAAVRLAKLAFDSRVKARSVTNYWRGVASTDRRTGRSRLDGPQAVLLQTVDRCPASCIMCPNSSAQKTGRVRLVDDGLYARLLAELRNVRTLRRFVLMLQNEPLLDRRLEERVRAAKDTFGPRAVIAVVTSGDLLSPERSAALIGAGVDELSISIDAHTAETYGQIRMGLDFGRVCRNVEALLAENPKITVGVRFLRQRENQHEVRDFVRHWKARGAGVFVHTVVNRAGSLESFEAVRLAERRPAHRLVQAVLRRLYPFCTLPLTAMSVLADGRVILCCHDWGAQAVVGDLTRQSLGEVWNGAAMCDARRALMAGRASDIEPCAQCSLRHGPWGVDGAA
jgi:MoaA/NifB/PqqE/SkfB family radical SAM enzyme